MNKKIFLILFSFLLLTLNASYTQDYKFTGKISDIKTDKPLSYATVKILDTTYGTTSDQNGNYIIKLKQGYYKVIYSYIGYFSDTASIFIENKNIERNIYLTPTDIMTTEIEVVGEDPAYDIIRKAISYKKLFKKELYEYNYDAYSKFVVRSNISATSEKDSTDDKSNMNIFGILESETKGYFRKPDLEKQIIKSKRETANIQKGFAIPLIVNFYDENIELNEIKIPGPLSDDAFDSYEYKLANITSIDSTKIYKINVINTSNKKPQFLGDIYIVDSIYALMKVNLKTNDVGLMRGLDNIDFIQKFSSYQDKNKKTFWMPTDIEIFAEGSFVGLIKFKGEVFTIVSNYNLNQKAPPGTFDDIVIKILPEASKKDTSYWEKNQLIKSTSEEKNTFVKIEKEEESKNRKISFGLTSFRIGNKFNMSWFDTYSFNRVQGHQIGINSTYNFFFEKFYFDAFLGYGFGDKKTKYDVNMQYKLLKDRSLQFNGRFFNTLNTIFIPHRNLLSIFENTLYTLFTKKDIFNYYYGNGFSLNVHKSVFPQLRLGINYLEEKQTSAVKRSDFSFLRQSQKYADNPQITNTFKRTIGFDMRIDPNEYYGIDWGDGEITRYAASEFPRFFFKYDYSGKSLNSNFEHRRYTMDIYGHHNFGTFLNLKYTIGTVFVNGTVPYQELATFPTYLQFDINNPGFIVMDYNEYLGDRIFFLNLENNFGGILWGNIRWFRRWDLVGFFNAGKTDISSSNQPSLLNYPFNSSTTDGVFMEAGFSIDRILEIARLNLGWRLNNLKDGKNFLINVSFSL